MRYPPLTAHCRVAQPRKGGIGHRRIGAAERAPSSKPSSSIRRTTPVADLTPPALNDASPFADMRGHHVAVRTPDFEIAKRWYVETLDFRVDAEWDYADQRLGYLASPFDDRFCIETIGGGEPVPQDVRPYSDLGGSLAFAGYHHFCLSVVDVAETLEELGARGVTIVAEPFVVEA